MMSPCRRNAAGRVPSKDVNSEFATAARRPDT